MVPLANSPRGAGPERQPNKQHIRHYHDLVRAAGRLLTMVALGLAGLSLAAADDEPTYLGAWSSGDYFTGARITDWHDANAQPKLAGRAMLDTASALSWAVIEGIDAPQAPPAFVEFFGGDLLPGRVVGHRATAETASRRWPPHLWVEPLGPVDMPSLPPRDRLPVIAAEVRRVVWRRRNLDRYQPGVAFGLDGRQVAFRALRWTDTGVQLLLADGRTELGFHELAEIHLPRRDMGECYTDRLALLAPGEDELLLQSDTRSGARLTTSLARLHARSTAAEPHNWWQLVQPAWSLAPIWIQHAQVYRRVIYAPHQPPLTWFDPVRVVEQPILGRGWPWQIDRNILGQPLRCGGRQFGWGWGLHANCELEFLLPGLAQGMESALGLDESVGEGGCVSAQVRLGRDAQEVKYASPPVIGSAKSLSTGRIAFDRADRQRQPRLALSVDALAGANRPTGADPLDIRDTFNWLEPRLYLDRQRLRAEASERLPRVLPGWQQWQPIRDTAAQPSAASADPAGQAPWLARHRFSRETGEFEFLVRPAGRTLRLRRVAPAGTAERQLRLTVQTPEDASPSRIEIFVNGQLASELDVPRATLLASPPPLVLPLAAWGDGELTVEVVHTADDERGFVEWRALEIGAPPPAVKWTPLVVDEVVSARSARFRRLDDHSLLLESKPAEFDTYEVTGSVELPQVTALRIEAIPDASLPGMGPGTGGEGNFVLGEVRATVDPASEAFDPVARREIEWSQAKADFNQQNLDAGQLIDGNGKNGWAIGPSWGTGHAAVLTLREGTTLAPGAHLRLLLVQETYGHHQLGRFRVALTDAPRALALDPTPQTLPIYPERARVLFDDQASFLAHSQGGQAVLDGHEKLSGRVSLRLMAPGQRTAARLPGVSVRIAERPQAGEYRFLQFAWKKVGGGSLCLQLAHNGEWGPSGGHPAPFRYQAGPGPASFGASIRLSEDSPAQWTVVTRDLFADFGEHLLTGFDLTVPDGVCAYLDRVVLAPHEADLPKPKTRPL